MTVPMDTQSVEPDWGLQLEEEQGVYIGVIREGCLVVQGGCAPLTFKGAGILERMDALGMERAVQEGHALAVRCYCPKQLKFHLEFPNSVWWLA